MSIRRLHIGGKEKKEGWEIFNICPGENVDHVGNANDLSRFEDNTFDIIYASHVLEHFDLNNEVVDTLREWFRVLSPKGKLFVAVPDLDALAAILLDKKNTTFDQRFEAIRAIYGAHVNQYDYHKVGFNQETLGNLLFQIGFVHIGRAKKFGLFNDCSNLAISLNLVAEKPEKPENK